MRCQTLSYGQIVGLTEQRGFRDPHMAAAIAMAESRGNTCATNANSNGSIDRGLFQINSVHGGLSTIDLSANLDAAYRISKGGTDWSAWVTYQTGAFKQFLNRGAHPAAASLGAAPASAAAPTSSSGLFSADQASGAVRALLWILTVLGGMAFVVFGLSQALGVGRPHLPNLPKAIPVPV